jgi:hypothetical protein
MEEPFLHRVEHSVHAQLFSMLTRHRELSESYPIGTTGRRTQLVHKEWPETIADVASGSNKRGNFDLAIIAPAQLADATLDHIRTGSIAAGIVIEMGLNYPLSHLDQDYHKLVSSQVAAGYLVHLARDVRRSEEVEKFLLSGDRNPQVKVAYAHCGERDDRAYKLVNDTHIRTA